MADLKLAFGPSTGIVITLASLASTAARQSAFVDNSGNQFVDALVALDFKLAAGSPSDDRAVYVFAYASEDGANYSDNASGSDAALTMRNPTNLRLVAVCNTPDSGGLTYKIAPSSVAAAFGGWLPRRWGIVVQNRSGLAFSATEGDHSKRFTGVYYQSV